VSDGGIWSHLGLGGKNFVSLVQVEPSGGRINGCARAHAGIRFDDPRPPAPGHSLPPSNPLLVRDWFDAGCRGVLRATCNVKG